MQRDYEHGRDLFGLLNGMDGPDQDHDLLFLLTTTRADVLEPALAARPGRIDQVVELPLSDVDGRRRLLPVYGESLDLTMTDDDPRSQQDGISPAFNRGQTARGPALRPWL